MTVDAPQRAGTPWWLVALAVAFVLGSAAVRSYGIKDPWLQGHMGWSGYRSGNIARNYVRFGYADTRLGAVRHIGPLRPARFVYDEHPPMIYWLASLGYQAFGVSEWSATLAPIACSALSAGLLFLLAYRWWGLAVAALAGAFMVFVPMDAYYGRMVDHEAPTLLFSLLSFYLYTLWKEKRSRGYFAALLGSLALAALSDFPGFFVGPWLAVYHFLSGPRRTTWKASLALLLSSPAFFLVWTAYLRWISGSFEILTSRFAIRTESWAPWVFTLGELYRLEFLRVRGLYTPTLLLLAAVWLAFMAWDVWHGRDLRRHGFLAMLGGFGVTYLALFHQNAYQHDFVAYYLTPFMCIAPAWAVTLLAGRLLSPRPAVVALLSVIVFIPFLGEAMGTLRQMYATRESAYVRVAQRLNGALPPGGKVLASVEDSTRNQWLFYLDRQTLPAADLGALEAHLRDPDVGYYVLDTRLSETTQELRDYLARRYPVEVMGPFLVFDLRGEGPGLVLDRLPAGVRAPAGEGYRDPYLTLAGYRLPAELSRPPVAPENQYLYSSSDYWPPAALAGNLSPDALAGDAGNPGGLDPRLTLQQHQGTGRGGDGQATPSFPRTRESRAFTSFPGVGLSPGALAGEAGGWPAGPDIPVQATLYWRVEQPVPEGHAPGVTLRGAYDRTYVVEPTYAPQAAAFPPQRWQPGEIVRADYTFKIPRGYPDIRYDLSVGRPGGKTEWTPVAGAVLAPWTVPAPLAQAPGVETPPGRPAESAPVPGLKFLGFDLDRDSAPAGGDVRARTYWQALPGRLGLKPHLDVVAREAGDYALAARLQAGDYTYTQPLEIGPTRLWEPGKVYAVDADLALPAGMLAGRYDLSIEIRGAAKGLVPLAALDISSDRQRGLLRRWGDADGSGSDMKPLEPEKPLEFEFDLPGPRDVMLAVHWTGRAELDRTRVEADAVNGSWYEPRKHLATWTVERGGPQVTWVRVPRALTAAGSNTLELSVPPPPAETRPTGWRGVLDAIAPGILDDPGAGDSGALEMDFAQVSAVRPDGSWAETRGLAEAYAARKMWVEVGDLYRKAVSEGQAPGSPEDLAVFLAAAQAAGDAGLKAQLDSQLAALIPHKVDVVLGRLDEPGGVRLLGYDIRRGRPGQARVTLYFEALKPLPADYTAWVHATPADPAVLFGQAQQAGHFTLDHRLETSTWTPGGIYRASYDAPLPPGDYDFSLGLWRWEDGSRLYRADNPAEHAVDLGRVKLQ